MKEYTDMKVGPITKAVLESYLHPRPIGQSIDDLERRIDAFEQRNEVLQRMVEMHQAKLEETGRRIEVMERKLNHKGGEQDG